jgi:hypothetical protein
MFTSDGFLIGAYRTAKTFSDYNAAIAHEQQGGGPLSWVPMQYCAGRCCGTWVAEGLEQQLLTSEADNSSLEFVPDVYLPVDAIQSWNYDIRFDSGVMTRFCALAQATKSSPRATVSPVSPNSVAPAPAQQQQQCPQRCQVACCARFANGSMDFERQNEFEQCAFNSCAFNCSLSGNSSASVA